MAQHKHEPSMRYPIVSSNLIESGTCSCGKKISRAALNGVAPVDNPNPYTVDGEPHKIVARIVEVAPRLVVKSDKIAHPTYGLREVVEQPQYLPDNRRRFVYAGDEMTEHTRDDLVPLFVKVARPTEAQARALRDVINAGGVDVRSNDITVDSFAPLDAALRQGWLTVRPVGEHGRAGYSITQIGRDAYAAVADRAPRPKIERVNASTLYRSGRPTTGEVLRLANRAGTNIGPEWVAIARIEARSDRSYLLHLPDGAGVYTVAVHGRVSFEVRPAPNAAAEPAPAADQPTDAAPTEQPADQAEQAYRAGLDDGRARIAAVERDHAEALLHNEAIDELTAQRRQIEAEVAADALSADGSLARAREVLAELPELPGPKGSQLPHTFLPAMGASGPVIGLCQLQWPTPCGRPYSDPLHDAAAAAAAATARALRPQAEIEAHEVVADDQAARTSAADLTRSTIAERAGAHLARYTDARTVDQAAADLMAAAPAMAEALARAAGVDNMFDAGRAAIAALAPADPAAVRAAAAQAAISGDCPNPWHTSLARLGASEVCPECPGEVDRAVEIAAERGIAVGGLVTRGSTGSMVWRVAALVMRGGVTPGAYAVLDDPAATPGTPPPGYPHGAYVVDLTPATDPAVDVAAELRTLAGLDSSTPLAQQVLRGKLLGLAARLGNRGGGIPPARSPLAVSGPQPAEPAAPGVKWSAAGDDRFEAVYRGRTWVLSRVDDGVLPDGWRVGVDGQDRGQVVAAGGRPMSFVFAQASTLVEQARGHDPAGSPAAAVSGPQPAEPAAADTPAADPEVRLLMASYSWSAREVCVDDADGRLLAAGAATTVEADRVLHRHGYSARSGWRPTGPDSGVLTTRVTELPGGAALRAPLLDREAYTPGGLGRVELVDVDWVGQVTGYRVALDAEHGRVRPYAAGDVTIAHGLRRRVDEVRALFRPGVEVVHRNAGCADWRGVVVEATRGSRAGQHLLIDADEGGPLRGWARCEVRVEWTAGATSTGWVDAQGLDVVTPAAE